MLLGAARSHRRRGRVDLSLRRQRELGALVLCSIAACLLVWAARTRVRSKIAADSIRLNLISRGGWNPWRGDAPDDTMPVIDVVSVSVKPTCVTKRAVDALNRHLGPRTIHVVSVGQEQCAAFRGHAPNVRCWLEDQMLRGVTKAGVGQYISRRFHKQGGEEYMGRSLQGWYFQQFLKLGAGSSIPGLSEYYIIWDLDMILHRQLHVLQRGAQGGLQTLVNFGGADVDGYKSSYRNLFHQGLSSAPDGSSFVTHWIVVHKPLMDEFLHSLAGNSDTQERGDVGTPWVWRILDAVRRSDVTLGFSEYASYVSWVHQHYPETQALAPRKTWIRTPVGGKEAIQYFRRFQAGGLCCPSAAHMLLTQLMGYQYSGFEIGHVSGCDYTKHPNSYGIPV